MQYKALLCTIVMILCLFSLAWAQQPAIVIGLQAPLTGSNAEFGEAMRNGTQLAVDRINAKGGINGRSVRG